MGRFDLGQVRHDVDALVEEVDEIPPDADLPLENIVMATWLLQAATGLLVWRRPDPAAPVRLWRRAILSVLTRAASRLMGVR